MDKRCSVDHSRCHDLGTDGDVRWALHWLTIADQGQRWLLPASTFGALRRRGLLDNGRHVTDCGRDLLNTHLTKV